MKILGLTGGIATGKSTVSQVFRHERIPIVDADRIARQVVEPGQPAYRALVRTFGEAILHPDGTLNRPRLGQIVFADEQLRRRLNAITHPAIRRQIAWETLGHYLRGEPLVVLDIPLLFESRLDRFVSDTVVVYCPEDTQLHRLMARDTLDEEACRQRMGAQMSMARKCELADHVVDNSGEREVTQEQTVC
ncbi:dephospho-CoA kinase [Dimargaris cristalligena]|uniref:Dephospho-CoA kinase n=1 Tax=Dimargaris cristalligena TaxID=215637 RepID=A0A4P9ZS88_9FUNG|nr:dephospho-CoA kinase [Dimargaris cristalligena]|eukprot:RKP36404.1 dephospho-CoA kinase [Dimargaris cristalligena]